MQFPGELKFPTGTKDFLGVDKLPDFPSQLPRKRNCYNIISARLAPTIDCITWKFCKLSRKDSMRI